MPEQSRPSLAPWITAVVTGTVLVALLLVYLLGLRPAERHANSLKLAAREQAGQLTDAEARAMDAAGTEMINLVTFSRAHFDTDFQRALDGATGSLRSDVQAKRSNTLAAMTQGKFDLYGRLTHKALEGPVQSAKQSGYVVLVTINGYRSAAPNTPIQQNLEVTVLNVKGKWLASDVTNIGVSG
ncbi:MAG TPA: hypothetical protein VKB75_00460 [Jatrophihabitans sp.]|nr:hypothetical protein [Jatrophihabitans sp.]